MAAPALGDYVWVYWVVGTQYGAAGVVTGNEYDAQIASLIDAGYGTLTTKPAKPGTPPPVNPNAALNTTQVRALLAGDGYLTEETANGTYAPLGSTGGTGTKVGTKAVVIGNSIDVSQEAPSVSSRNSSWFNYCSILTRQQFTYGYNAGVGGDTTAMMLARFDADVAPHSPSIVIIGGPENDADPANGVSVASFAANMMALAAKVRDIGASLVIRTACASNGDGTRKSNIIKMNTWLRDHAPDLNAIAVLDFYAVTVDPITGNLRSTYDSGDGIHPNDLGNWALGKRAADILTPLLSYWSPALPYDNADSSNLLSNGLMVGPLEGPGADQVPAWYTNKPSDASAIASLVPQDFGNWYRLALTNSSAPVQVIQGHPITGMDNHTILYSARIKSNLTAGKLGSFDIGTDNGLFIRSTYDMAGTIDDGVISVRAVVPPGATYLNVAHTIPAGATGDVQLAQVAIYDLTALGVVP